MTGQTQQDQPWSRRVVAAAREVLAFGPNDRAQWVAIRVAVSTAVPLVVVWQLGHLPWAVYVTFGAFAAVYGRHAPYPDRLRMQVGAGALLTAAVGVGTAVGVLDPGSVLAVAAMSVVAGVGFLVARCGDWKPPGALFFVFATGSTSSVRHTPPDIATGLAVAAGTALLSVAVGQAGRLFPARWRVPRAAVHRVRLRQLLATSANRWQLAQYLVAPVLAGLIALAVGIGHPYWAAVTATVPLSGGALAGQLTRGVRRLIGTLLGVAIGSAVLSAHPADLGVVVIFVIVQGLAEIFALRNYALTVAAITPLALLMSHLGAPRYPIDRLAADRTIETLLGIAAAAAVLLLRRSRPKREA